MDEHGLAELAPALRSEVRRRYDPVDARLRVAQALLNRELDRSWMAELGQERIALEIERGAERLGLAESIADEAWPARPASWLAPMVIGGARYLSAVRGGDTRLMGESERWELPLLAAQRLAPAQDGPVRFLAAAYLGNWSTLSEEQRSTTVDVLARAFADRRTFQLLIEDWLRVAPSRSRALEIVPEEPWAWRLLQQLFSISGDWQLFAATRQRWYETFAADADRQLDEISGLIAGGEVVDSRNRLLRLVYTWPRSTDFAPRFERLLSVLPPGPPSSDSSKAFSEWLHWALELCLLGECPFEQTALSRLARLSGDIEPSSRAMAHLAAGDLARASLLERRFATAGSREWAPYFQLKALHLAEDGQGTEAAASLERIPAAWRDRPGYWVAASRVALAADDADGAQTAETRLAALSRADWGQRDWREGLDGWTLDLLPHSASAGVELEITGAGRQGAAIEVSLDSRLLGVRWVSRSPEVLRFELPVSARPHRISVNLHGRGPVRPGAVRML